MSFLAGSFELSHIRQSGLDVTSWVIAANSHKTKKKNTPASCCQDDTENNLSFPYLPYFCKMHVFNFADVFQTLICPSAFVINR